MSEQIDTTRLREAMDAAADNAYFREPCPH